MEIRLGKKAKLREELEEIVKWLQVDHPDIYADVVEIAEEVKLIKKNLKNKSGASDDHTICRRCITELVLGSFIKKRYGTDFFQHQENREVFNSVFEALAITK